MSTCQEKGLPYSPHRAETGGQTDRSRRPRRVGGEQMNARILSVVAACWVVVACSPQAPPPTAAAAATLLPRTSWGDPSLEGTYTNKDEYGTPFERPDELAGKSRNEFGPEAMAALVA